MVGNASLLFY